MASFDLPSVTEGMSTDELVVVIGKMRKMLDWLLYNMDSKNVTELNTNVTRIKSQKGETYINGPLLEMNDRRIPRLKMGYDEVSDEFNFLMWDLNGNNTMYINDSGEAVFAGNIETRKDAHIGNNLYLGYGNTEYPAMRKITFLEGDTPDSGVYLRAYKSFAHSKPSLWSQTDGQYNIYAGESMTLSSPFIYIESEAFTRFSKPPEVSVDSKGMSGVLITNNELAQAFTDHIYDYHLNLG